MTTITSTLDRRTRVPILDGPIVPLWLMSVLHYLAHRHIRLTVVRTALGVVAIISLGLTARVARSRIPRFEGRTLEQWARHFTAHPTADPRAFQQLGPMLVPHLLAEIERAHDPFDRDLACRFWQVLHSLAPAFLEGRIPDGVPKEERGIHAVILLARLGPDASAAVPRLTLLLDDDAAVGSSIRALAAIGVPARSAVPALIEKLEAGQPWAASALVQIDPESVEVQIALAQAAASPHLGDVPCKEVSATIASLKTNGWWRLWDVSGIRLKPD